MTTVVLPFAIAEDVSRYEWRPARRADVPAIHRMLVAVDTADESHAAGSLEDTYRDFEDPWHDPATDSLLALTPDGAVAAYGRAFLNPEPNVKELVAYPLGEVHPEYRGRGLGEYLFTWLKTRARARLLARPGDQPRLMRAFTPDDQPDRIAMFERHGFRPARYSYRMRRALSQPIPELSLPAGLTLTRYDPKFERAMMEAFNETFGDHWGFQRITEEDWQLFFIQRSTFRPDLTFLALAGDTIAGFSYNWVSPDDNARQGVNEGWIGDLGVRRPWRQRGVASALICHSMRAFKETGLEYATLGVDTENLTGALRIYERLGFVAFKRAMTYQKHVEVQE